jgi:subtilase family serine protease
VVIKHGSTLPSDATTSPVGLSPQIIKQVYGYSTSPKAGAGQTIAIVDSAYDPTAGADLAGFSAQYKLPPCTMNQNTYTGCLTQEDQWGCPGIFNLYQQPTGADTVCKGHLVEGYAPDMDWGLETSLDIEWAHAIAPDAHLILVEAESADNSDIMIAEATAMASGAGYVSNSWPPWARPSYAPTTRSLVIPESPSLPPPETSEALSRTPLRHPTSSLSAGRRSASTLTVHLPQSQPGMMEVVVVQPTNMQPLPKEHSPITPQPVVKALEPLPT